MNDMNHPKKTLMALALAAGFTVTPALALDYELFGMPLQLDNRVTVGGAWRMEGRDANRIGIANGGNAYSTNGDDGNLAFDNGDLVAAAAKLTSDLTLSRGNFGIFLRGSYLFDANLHDHDFFNADNYYTTPSAPGVGLTPTGRASVAPISEYRYRNKKVRDQLGNDADLLDAYVYGSFNVASRDVGFKIGRQVINWGESTFILNGINSIMAFDANQLRVPGSELDETAIPTAMAWISATLVPKLSMEAFYQLDWQQTYVDAPGSFWGSNDFAGIGGTRANITFGLPPENTPNTTIPRARDNRPSDGGQYGAKLSTTIAALNEMDLSVYAMNYHSRLPLVSGISKASYAAPSETGGYFIEYPEDIRLYGVSFNTVIGDWSLQGEYSYKVDQPLQVEDVELLLAGVGLPSQVTPPPAAPLGSALGGQYIRGYRRHEVSHADFSLTRLLGPLPLLGYDQLLLLAEAGAIYVHDLPDPSVLRYEGPGTYLPGDAAVSALITGSTLPIFGRGVPQQVGGYATDFSWGYKLVARLQYNNVFNLFRLEPTIRFDHDVEGITPTPLVNFVEGRKSLTTKITAAYLQTWSADIGYTRYFGGGAQNLLSDRDYIEALVKYTF